MTLKYLPDPYIKKLLGRDPSLVSLSDIRSIEDRLTPFGLETLTDSNEVVSLPIPDGFGSVREELEKAYATYSNGWEKLEALVATDAPSFPTSWNVPLGWSYWTGKQWQPIAKAPSSRTFVLDAETVEVSPGIWHPTCMVAMSAQGWLVWRADLEKIADVSVVPFSTGNNILGYNISYDRSYIDVEYRYQDSGNKFYDLMSMWIVTNGMSNQQRTVFAKFGKDSDDNSDDDDDYIDFNKPVWLQKTGTNGLASAYKFYTEKELDKGVRDGIVEGGLSWVVDNMPEVIRYCALDVLATHELAKYLFPAYKLHRPSPVNRYGSVALGSCWVPLSAERFPSFYQNVETVYQANKVELNDLLLEACSDYLDRYENDIPDQALTLDWTPAKTGKNKGLPQWYRDVLSTYRSYKKHLDQHGSAEKGGLSLSQRYAPIILEMRWDGELLKWKDTAKGWYTDKHGMIPHPTKRGQPVGNMFLKDFSSLYDTEFISVPEYVKTLVEKRVSAINWVSSRKRIASIRTESPDGFPVTIPQMVVNGTITGRATDPIWLVAANPKANRMGTELKSMVAPYPGYALVGADVNS